MKINDAHCHYGNESLVGRLERLRLHSNNPYEKIKQDLDAYEIQNQVLFAQPCPASTLGYIKGALMLFPRGIYSSLQQNRDMLPEGLHLGKSNTTEPKIFFGNVDYNRTNQEISRLEDTRIEFVPFVNSHFKPSDIKEFNGIKGVKFYETYGDIPEELLNYLNNQGLNLILHRDLTKGPEHILDMVAKNSGINFQIAHWATGSRKITGALDEYSNLFVDTAGSSLSFYTKHLGIPFKQIAQEHPDKVLFGSDEPWANLGKEIEAVTNLGLGKETEEKILYKNYYKLWK
jgi:hypothetical protein